MILLAWIQGWELYPVAGRSENSGLWILALLLTGVIYVRSRRSGPMLPPADARRALESMEQEGLRDVRWEGHLQACLSWCRTYAVVTLLAAVAVFYTFLVVARARSPLSWLPLIVLAMAFALHIYNRNRG